MRRFPKETIFQEQISLMGTVDVKGYPLHLQYVQEEEPEKYYFIQRLDRKRFL
jgi:hypothetical protein